MFAEVTLGAMIGLVGGIATSWAFWRYRLRHKPRLALSTQVACQRTVAGESDYAWRYQVKIANLGKRQVVDLRVECHVAGRKPIPGGYMRTVNPLPVKASTHAVLGPATRQGTPFGITPVWYVVMYGDDDLRETLSEDERVLVTLLATDAISGTTVARRMEYDPGSLVEGQFPFGLDVNVIPAEQVPEERPALPGQREAVGSTEQGSVSG